MSTENNEPILTLDEGLDVLRLDVDNTTTGIVEALIEAIPQYIETTCGVEWQKWDDLKPLVKTLAGFVLQLWYNPDGTDSNRLQTVIRSLSKSIKAEAVARAY